MPAQQTCLLVLEQDRLSHLLVMLGTLNRASACNDMRHVTLQLREDAARRNEMNARTSLRTCEDHSCTMNTLVNADGVPPDFINGADAKEAAALAQQPWYCVLYVAQVQMRPHCHASAWPATMVYSSTLVHMYVFDRACHEVRHSLNSPRECLCRLLS